MPNATKVQAELRATAGSGYKTVFTFAVLWLNAFAGYGATVSRGDMGAVRAWLIIFGVVYLLIQSAIRSKRKVQAEFVEEDFLELEPLPTKQAKQEQMPMRLDLIERDVVNMSYDELEKQKRLWSKLDTKTSSRIFTLQKKYFTKSIYWEKYSHLLRSYPAGHVSSFSPPKQVHIADMT